jgi:LDH2 family malate/lactate/ureidoglycolate dehydrogenase
MVRVAQAALTDFAAALLAPNPMAAGFPTSGDPVLVDVSSSIPTTTMTQNLAREGAGLIPNPGC